MSTERPASFSAAPPRLVAVAKSLRQTLACAPWMKRRDAASPSQSLRTPGSLCDGIGGIFVGADEVAERHRKIRVLARRERIDPQRILEPRDQHGEAERIEPGVEQVEVVGERRQLLVVLGCDLSDLRE